MWNNTLVRGVCLPKNGRRNIGTWPCVRTNVQSTRTPPSCGTRLHDYCQKTSTCIIPQEAQVSPSEEKVEVVILLENLTAGIKTSQLSHLTFPITSITKTLYLVHVPFGTAPLHQRFRKLIFSIQNG